MKTFIRVERATNPNIYDLWITVNEASIRINVLCVEDIRRGIYRHTIYDKENKASINVTDEQLKAIFEGYILFKTTKNLPSTRVFDAHLDEPDYLIDE